MSRNGIDCTELPLKNSNAQVKSLWRKIRYHANRGNIVFCVYYRPPGQEEEVDEEFFFNCRKNHAYSSDPDMGLQPPKHLLVKQCSELQAVQETTEGH